MRSKGLDGSDTPARRTGWRSVLEAVRRNRPWPEIGLAVVGIACIVAALIVQE